MRGPERGSGVDRCLAGGRIRQSLSATARPASPDRRDATPVVLTVALLLVVVVQLFVVRSAAALESLAVYEDWSEADGLIRPDRWQGDAFSGGQEVARR